MSAGQTAEERLLALLRRRLSPGPPLPETGLRVAIGDDAAVWRPRTGYETVVTCDWFLEGTHFLPRCPARLVAWKALARAVSDVAAMGGVPRCFLLGLALPASRSGRWFEEFLR